MRALFILGLRQMLGGKKIWILGLFLALPLLLAVLIRFAAGFDFPTVDGIEIEEYAMSGFLYPFLKFHQLYVKAFQLLLVDFVLDLFRFGLNHFHRGEAYGI